MEDAPVVDCMGRKCLSMKEERGMDGRIGDNTLPCAFWAYVVNI